MKNIFKLILILMMPAVLLCQNGNQVLKNLQTKFESITNFSSEFSQSSRFADSKKPITYLGKFFFEKENKYRIELKNSEIISDGKTIWNYNKAAKKVILGNAEDNSSSFSLKNIVYEYPSQSNVEYVGKETMDGKSCEVIRLTPKERKKSFEAIKIWVDDSNLIKKVEISDNNGATLEFELSNIKLNQKISNDKFNFSPTKGIEVIDLR
ncbi:MAG: outer membrane lipoprotein chaperone LolA [Ignavibacteriales bacterium]|nr:outer membrane lipoprotein chaperone LolA [Ignavibacteriales bacterium]